MNGEDVQEADDVEEEREHEEDAADLMQERRERVRLGVVLVLVVVREVEVDAEHRQTGAEQKQTQQVQLVPHRPDVLLQTLLEAHLGRIGDHLLATCTYEYVQYIYEYKFIFTKYIKNIAALKRHLMNFLAKETDNEKNNHVVVIRPGFERAAHETVAERRQKHEICHLRAKITRRKYCTKK